MFHGSIVALVTPFTQEGEVDLGALGNLIEWHIEEGTDAIILCGTTGEAPTLSDQEQEAVFKQAVSVSYGRIPLIAGTGTYDTRKSVEKTIRAKEIGVDACLVIVPYYNRPSPQGCYVHYEHVASANLPVIVYHHPVRTGVTLSALTITEIAKIPNVVGIKEASGSLDLIKELNLDIPIFSGDDTLTLSMMELGAKGIMSVIANLIPREWKEFVSTLEKKDFVQGRKLHEKYLSLCNTIMLEPNPQGIKYAMSLIGKCPSSFRLPLIEPCLENQERIKLETSQLFLDDSKKIS